jgi:membrane-bound inhibitor of C-type lysozyme
MPKRLPLSAACLPLLVACAAPEPAPPAPGVMAQRYACGPSAAPLRFTAQAGPDYLDIWLADGYRRLPRVPSASGTRYADESVSFFGKGQEAMLDIGDQRYRGCRMEAPASR